MSALVTGGAGFIGRHVVADLLKRGQAVRVLDDLSRARPGSLDAFAQAPTFLGLINGDVTDLAVVARASLGVDTIFHLAASVAVSASVRDPTAAMRTNVLGSLNVADDAKRAGLHLILVSTCHVYAPAHGPLDERAPTEPASPYAASKLAAEQIVRGYAVGSELRLTILRPFNVYGPWQQADAEGGVVARYVARALAGEPLEVHGDGEQTRDFVYVTDCARGIADAARQSAQGHVINLATGVETSIVALARCIAGPEHAVRHVPHPHPSAEVPRYRGDATLAGDLLGWQPRVGLADGLDRTRAWFAADRAR